MWYSELCDPMKRLLGRDGDIRKILGAGKTLVY
jgi:hypothetical protein